MQSNELEDELAAKAVAPRVTLAEIEAQITREHYFTAAEGAVHPGAINPTGGYHAQSLKLLTFCVLVLRNGYTVTGTSACASAENFDAAIGRKVARLDAVAKVWPLLGYALREQLAARS